MYLPIDQIMKQRGGRAVDDGLLTPSATGVGQGRSSDMGDSSGTSSGIDRPDRFSSLREGRG